MKTAPATLGNIRGVVHATGVVTPAPGAELVVVAPEAARIAEIPHAAGDRVRRGDLLVRFEIPNVGGRSSAPAGRSRSRRRRRSTTRRRRRRARASCSNAASPRAGKSRTPTARWPTQRRRSRRRGRRWPRRRRSPARAIVRATFDGIVAKRHHNPGDLVEATASDPVLRVIDPRRLEVVASVPLADASRIEVGAPAIWRTRRRRTGSRPESPLASGRRRGRHRDHPGAPGIRASAELPAGTPVQVDIEAEQHTDVVLIPAVADRPRGRRDGGVRRQRREGPTARRCASDSPTERTSRSSPGVKAGELVIVDGQAGLPDGAAITTAAEKDARRQVNVAALALRHSRAIGLLAAALVISGALAAFALPSGIYPPLQFPRIVIVAHSGTLPPQSMSLIVTRPIEQVVMAVPGVRRVRSKSIRGASEISAQFDPSTDMVVALQMVQNRVAEITGDLPADTELQIERMTPEIFPVFILSLTGTLPTADLYDYANFVVKPELARVPGAGIIEVQASDTREIEVVLDPAKLAAADLTVVDVSDALKAQNTDPAGRTISGIGAAAPDARIGALEERRSDRGRAGQGQERRDHPRLGPRNRHARRAGSDPARHGQIAFGF